MTDDLRTRIISALLSEDDVALMADAVIAELGLREELVSGVPFNGVLQRRIVSDWETFNSSEGG